MTDAEIKRAAPTVDLWLMRPVMHNPPLYTLKDLREWVTIQDVFDAEEIMNLEAAQAEKSERIAKANARRR